VFFAPEFGGYFLEYNNFIPADPLKTPLHIAPVWYFTPLLLHAARHHQRDDVRADACAWSLGAARSVMKLQAAQLFKGGHHRRGCRGGHALMLAIDAKFWGVVVMGGAVIILFFLPWLDFSPVKSIRYRPTGTSTCTASSSSTS
jgi:ubiquinol-cytochrome c reductase cytochrome b subunit